MNAMILAAGFGSRLAALGEPKPLVAVAGIAMIELSVLQAARAGFTHFVVVTGHHAEPLDDHLVALAIRTGLSIDACRLDDWSQPNGHSVLAGSARISGNYLLMMADHIFSDGVLAAMAAQMQLKAGATLAIDRAVAGPLIDPDDATFVALGSDNRITSIGKGLRTFDAVDCGAFVATPDLAVAIAEAIAHGAAGSLSEGMQRLADRGLADTVDVTGQWWIDVDDPHMHALAQVLAPQHLPDVFATTAAACAA